MNNETSTAPTTNLGAACPSVGNAYVWFAPIGTALPTNDISSV